MEDNQTNTGGSLGGLLGSLGEAVMPLVEPVHDALDPKGDQDKKDGGIPYYVGGTIVLTLVGLMAYRKFFPKKRKYRRRRTTPVKRYFRRK